MRGEPTAQPYTPERARSLLFISKVISVAVPAFGCTFPAQVMVIFAAPKPVVEDGVQVRTVPVSLITQPLETVMIDPALVQVQPALPSLTQIRLEAVMTIAVAVVPVLTGDCKVNVNLISVGVSPNLASLIDARNLSQDGPVNEFCS